MKLWIQSRLVLFFCVCLFALCFVVFNFFSFYNCSNRRIRLGVFASLLRPNSDHVTVHLGGQSIVQFATRTCLHGEYEQLHKRILLSWSSLEPRILLDLVCTKLYCFKAIVHCYYCLYIIYSANPVRRSEELRGDQKNSQMKWSQLRGTKDINAFAEFVSLFVMEGGISEQNMRQCCTRRVCQRLLHTLVKYIKRAAFYHGCSIKSNARTGWQVKPDQSSQYDTEDSMSKYLTEIKFHFVIYGFMYLLHLFGLM